MNGTSQAMKAGGRGKVAFAFFVSLLVLLAGFVIIRSRWSGSLRWKDHHIVVAQFRGPTGLEQPPVYPEEELQIIATRMSEALATSYDNIAPPEKRTWFGPKTDWVMKASLNELFDGSFMLDLQAYSVTDDRLMTEWSLEYESRRDFEEHLAANAEEIAEGLALLRVGTRP